MESAIIDATTGTAAGNDADRADAGSCFDMHGPTSATTPGAIIAADANWSAAIGGDHVLIADDRVASDDHQPATTCTRGAVVVVHVAGTATASKTKRGTSILQNDGVCARPAAVIEVRAASLPLASAASAGAAIASSSAAGVVTASATTTGEEGASTRDHVW